MSTIAPRSCRARDALTPCAQMSASTRQLQWTFGMMPALLTTLSCVLRPY